MGASSRDRNPASIRHLVGSAAEPLSLRFELFIGTTLERARALMDAMNT